MSIYFEKITTPWPYGSITTSQYSCLNYSGKPWGDLSNQGEGASLRVGEVHALHLHHHLPHHVVAAVAVKGQHHKVQCKNLEKESSKNVSIYHWAYLLSQSTHSANLKVPRCTLCRKKIQNENVVSGFPGSLVFRSTDLIKNALKWKIILGEIICEGSSQ